jgi:hypothetical protein
MIPQPAVVRGGRGAEVGVVLACLALFLVACAAPALEFLDTNAKSLNVMQGFQILLMGWMGVFVGQLAWFANPLFALGLLLLSLRRRTAALVCGTGAMLAAGDTFVLFSQQLPANEGGVGKLILQHLRAGFYFWAAALVLLPLGALILRHRTESLQKPGPSLA